MPGGVESVVFREQNLNHSESSDVIVVNNAPGFQLDFSPVAENFTFDFDNDCAVFGEGTGAGIQICLWSDNSTLMAGNYASRTS
jgi:hypothetical protein